MKKLFSIIIPSYNANKKLEILLSNFYKLNFDLFDLIIIDDFSNKKQKKYIPKESFNKVFFIRNEKNLGLSITRNIGINFSSSKYLIFIDADDKVDIETLNNFANHIYVNNIDVDLIRVGITKVNNGQEKNLFTIKKNKYFKSLNFYLLYVFFIKNYTTITSVTHIYNKTFLKNNLFINQRILSEDLEHFFRVTNSLKKIYVTNFNYYFHVFNEFSITNFQKKQLLIDQKKIYQNSKKYIQNIFLKLIYWIFYILVYQKNSKDFYG